MENSRKLDLRNLFVSTSLLIYFTFLVCISYYSINTGRLEATLEMITLPLIVVLVAMIIYNIWKFYKQSWKLNSYDKLSLLILLVTVMLLSYATIQNI